MMPSHAVSSSSKDDSRWVDYSRWVTTKKYICKYFKKGECKHGEECVAAHSREEQRMARDTTQQYDKAVEKEMMGLPLTDRQRHLLEQIDREKKGKPKKEKTKVLKKTVVAKVPKAVLPPVEEEPDPLPVSVFNHDALDLIQKCVWGEVALTRTPWADMNDDTDDDEVSGEIPRLTIQDNFQSGPCSGHFESTHGLFEENVESQSEDSEEQPCAFVKNLWSKDGGDACGAAAPTIAWCSMTSSPSESSDE